MQTTRAAGPAGPDCVCCLWRRQTTAACTIAVIPKGTTHEFWQSIHAGAIKAERELDAEGVDVRITWKGPLREDDREQQIQVVEGFLSQGVYGIVLAPLDAKALVRPVEEARAAGIPTVIIDSDLAADVQVSFVATDNYRGGPWRPSGSARLLEGQGQGADAAVSGRLGQHGRARAGLPRRG